MNNQTLIISDVHLTKEFSKQKFEAMRNAILQTNQVIINGDFWKNTKTTFEEFINSEWNQLFPLLKSKNCIYITGNHDPINEIDENYKLFASKICTEYELRFGKKIVKIQHGHNTHWILKALTFIHKYTITLDRTFYLHKYSEAKQSKLTNKYSYPKTIGTKIIANLLKEHVKKKSASNVINICGHSHVPEIDMENRYVNTGFFDFNYGYITYIDKNGKIKTEISKY